MGARGARRRGALCLGVDWPLTPLLALPPSLFSCLERDRSRLVTDRSAAAAPARMVLYHLAPAPAWAACVESNAPYKPPTFESDGGFVHLTADPSKLIAVGNQFYKCDPHAWVLLELTDTPAGGPVEWEAAAPVGDTPPAADFAGETFPHLYGPILPADVLRVLPVQRGAGGAFLGVDGVC